MNNTGTKFVRIMKQTSFLKGKNGEYIPCLKYSNKYSNKTKNLDKWRTQNKATVIEMCFMSLVNDWRIGEVNKELKLSNGRTGKLIT